uniref:Secreted protein n=1 Tax=Schistosoma curassoni TaxID=6186 RepID=A0A183JLK9_9TREM
MCSARNCCFCNSIADFSNNFSCISAFSNKFSPPTIMRLCNASIRFVRLLRVTSTCLNSFSLVSRCFCYYLTIEV